MNDDVADTQATGVTEVELPKLNPVRIASASSTTLSHEDGIKEAQLSPDGTCIITSSNGPRGGLSTFILPPNLLEPDSIHDLSPYASSPSSDPIYAFLPSPYFNLSDPTTCLVVSSVRDHPIRLTNALSSDAATISSYKIIDEMTEVYITPHSFVFTPDGAQLISGCDALLAVHDISRDGSLPIMEYPTIPSKSRKAPRNVYGMKGIISSLSINPSTEWLAAGTLQNRVGLYTSAGQGETITTFSIEEDATAAVSDSGPSTVGTGITQVTWSPCGNYLVVAGRKSDVALIYDVRTYRRVCWLMGRAAYTNQPCKFDITRAGDGWEVWAGGADGVVKMWKDPHLAGGEVRPSEQWKAHDDPVTAALVHGCGNVVVTVAAKDRNASLQYESDSEEESSDEESGEEGYCSTAESSAVSGSDSGLRSRSLDDEDAGQEDRPGAAVLKVWTI